MKYFKLSEFDSPDMKDSGFNMDPDFLETLDLIRESAGIPFVINSGYRTRTHNLAVGGKKESAHLLGKAADIKAVSGHDKFVIIQAAIIHGIMRIGIGDTFVHLDNAVDSLPWPTIWTY
jgi:zinc D-Ala-D-Ala carboxypeptidase